MTEPTREATEPAPPEPASSPAPNGDDELSLARMSDDGAPPPEPPRDPAPSSGTPPAADALSLLEQRVRRLEDALAQLQQQHGIETRVVTHLGTPRPADRPPAAPPAPTGVRLDVGKRLLGTAADTVPPAPAPPPPPTARGRLLWLLRDTWAEARAIVRMFVDPRHRLPWSARVLPLILLAGILIPKRYWVPGAQIPILGDWLLSKAVDLLLAFVLFKWLGHESRRYRQTAPDLPPTLRL